MFDIRKFFTFAAFKTKPAPKPSNVIRRANGTYYFAHVERNKYAPWGRGIKLEGKST